MKIKVYNDNGNIKITKVIGDNVEQTLFGSLLDGEVAEINVEVANLSVTGEKKRSVDLKLVTIRDTYNRLGIRFGRAENDLKRLVDIDEIKKEFYTRMNNSFHILPSCVDKTKLTPEQFFKYICNFSEFSGLKWFLCNGRILPDDDIFKECFEKVKEGWEKEV